MKIQLSKLTVFILFILFFFAIGAKAQIMDGSIPPNWTLTDLNGNSHTLYSDLDAGKTVFINFSATWDEQSWILDTANTLEDLWENHGPLGDTNVSSGTTNDVMVYFIEAEATNTNIQLHGPANLPGSAGFSTGTWGDWVTGKNYPIIDPDANTLHWLDSAYQINNILPTVYKICPNRVIKKMNTSLNATAMYAEAGTCPAPADSTADAALLYLPPSYECDMATLKIRLQNNSTTPLTSCTIVAKNNTSTVATFNWTGILLNAYDYKDVIIGTAAITDDTTTFTYTIISDTSISTNDSMSGIFYNSALKTTSNAITIKITTDMFGSDLSWTLKNTAGILFGSGDSFMDQGAPGQYPQTDVNLNLLPDCYVFQLNDAIGDGFTGATGNGSATIVAGGVDLFSLTNFTTNFYQNLFKVNPSSAGLEENRLFNDVNVFPNPTTNSATVNFKNITSNTVSISLINTLGQSVLIENIGNMNEGIQSFSLDASNLDNGIYFLNITIGEKTITKKLGVNK